MNIIIQSISDKGTSKPKEIDVTGVTSQQALDEAIDKTLDSMTDEEFGNTVEALDAYHDLQSADREEQQEPRITRFKGGFSINYYRSDIDTNDDVIAKEVLDRLAKKADLYTPICAVTIEVTLEDVTAEVSPNQLGRD